MNAKTLLNAVIGAVVTVVTSFVPLSPILGGGIAAWLEGGNRSDGLAVGALSGGLITLLLLPFLFLALLLAPFDMGITFVVMLFVVAFATIYLVGFGALGGYIGGYLKEEYGSSDPPGTWSQSTLSDHQPRRVEGASRRESYGVDEGGGRAKRSEPPREPDASPRSDALASESTEPADEDRDGRPSTGDEPVDIEDGGRDEANDEGR